MQSLHLNARSPRMGRMGQRARGHLIARTGARRSPDMQMSGLGAINLSSILSSITTGSAAAQKATAAIKGPTTTTTTFGSGSLSPMMMVGLGVGGLVLAKILRIF